MQALDLWTDDFASVGTGTPATKAGDCLIAGPNWSGTPPPGVKQVFRSSTRHAWVLVQMSSRGPQDWPAIQALHDPLKITPLAAWGKPYSPPAGVPVDPAVVLTATPYDQGRRMAGERFFTRLARLLKDNPPKPADATALEWLSKIGVEPGKEFDASQLNAAEFIGLNKFAFNADGSLDISVQAASPGKGKETHWVPSPPSGAFNLTVRIYQPKKEALDGSYELPPVRWVKTP